MRWTLCYPNMYETKTGVKIIAGEWRKVSYTGQIMPRRYGFIRTFGKIENIKVPNEYKRRISPSSLEFLARCGVDLEWYFS